MGTIARRTAGSPARPLDGLGLDGAIGDNGKEQIRADQAARERGDHWSRGPWQDDVDGGDHDRAEQAVRRRGQGVRPDRRGARGEGARHHHQHRPRRVRDQEPALRARRLPRARRLRQEHDHRCGADGRRHPGGERGRRPHAADARAHPAGPPGGRAVHHRLHEQVRHGRRRRAARARRDGSARAARQVRVPGRRHPDRARLGQARPRRRQGRARRRQHPEARRGARHLHPRARAGHRRRRS